MNKTREALVKIATGDIVGIVDMAIEGQWQGVVNAMQGIAREALLTSDDQPLKYAPLEWSKCKSFGGRYKWLAFDCFGNEFKRFDEEPTQDQIDGVQYLYETLLQSAIAK